MGRYVHPSSVTGRFVLANVTVVDPRDGTAIAGQDVLVEQGRIAAVTGTGTAGQESQVVDGAGRYVVPGFNDLHLHALNTLDDVDATYALLLANGVVGFRQMAGSRELLAARREGRLPQPPGAPALLATCGDLLTPLNASTPAAAVGAVQEQHADGADFVKAGMTTRETLLAALTEANRLGIRLGGHLAPDLDPAEAARGGMWSIEHLGPGVTVFAATSDREAVVRSLRATRKLPPLPRVRFPGAQRLVMKLVSGLAVNPAAVTSAQEAQALELADASYDQARAEELAAVFIEHRTWQCPTLIRMHTQQFADAPVHTQDPRRRYMHPAALKSWDASTARFSRLPAATREVLRQHWPAQLRLTRTFADAGVPMVTGTDACTAAGIIPGFGLHDEFDLLAEAGVTTSAILAMTTTNAAAFLGDPDAFGRVAPGQPADLVLLEADPVLDHRALHTVAGVVRDGAWWSRADLDGILARVAADPGAR